MVAAPRVRESVADIDTALSVAIFSGLGLLLSLSVLIIDKYTPGRMVLSRALRHQDIWMRLCLELRGRDHSRRPPSTGLGSSIGRRKLSGETFCALQSY